ncbi:MAG TPA: PilX N-terminal domain-containing pilus assembly protein [Xanthomonadaceae bacterium]|jgi:type IV pilus assembly protein PilX
MNKPMDPQFPRRQRGAALMVVLILLLIMTLLGLASLRGTLMDQRMSANTYDRNLSLQEAEAALREGEAVLAPGVASSSFTSACTSGLCSQPVAAAGTLDRWSDTSFNNKWQNVSSSLITSLSVEPGAGTPQYFIEYMGVAPNFAGCDQVDPILPQCLTPRYRVTARNADPTVAGDRSMVYLQSTYASISPSP